MPDLLRQFEEDRAMRDAAKRLIGADVGFIRRDVHRRSVGARLLDRAEGPDMHLEFVKGADHRFSDPACLALLTARVEEVLALIEA